jgi:hypothetical protein
MDLKEMLVVLLQAYFPQLLLVIVGLLLETMFVVSRDEIPKTAEFTGPVDKPEPVRSKAEAEGKEGREKERRKRQKGQEEREGEEREQEGVERVKLGPVEFPPPRLPHIVRRGLSTAGLALWATALIWIVVAQIIAPVSFASDYSGAATVPPVSLISLGYMVDGYDLHLVDLRRAETSGIPAGSGRTLQFQNIWIWVAEDAPEYGVQVEIYEDPQLTSVVGVTELVPLHAGYIQLSDVKVTAFKSDPDERAWRVPSHWTDLYVCLVTYLEGEQVNLAVTTIHLDANGTAWLLDPPSAKFASIVYSVNDGAPQVLDLRHALEIGLDAAPGDMLSLLGIWYHADASSDDTGKTMHLEAYLSEKGYDADTYCVSAPMLVEKGIQELLLKNVTCEHDKSTNAFRWVIPSNRKALVVSLVRSDRALLDRLILGFGGSAGSAGLVDRRAAVMWPFEKVHYIDFESPTDLDEWSGKTNEALAQSSDQAFTGNYALAVTTMGYSEDEGFVEAQWSHRLRGEVIVGQVYWPDQEGVRLVWAQACVWSCVPIESRTDQWNAFVMDLSEMTYDDKPLNTVEFPGIWIQMQLDGVSEANPYTFFVDGIQVYLASEQ